MNAFYIFIWNPHLTNIPELFKGNVSLHLDL